MRTFKLILLVFVCTLCYHSICFSQFIQTESDLKIIYPRAHSPIFIEPKGEFVVELRLKGKNYQNGWKASLYNDLKNWNCVIKRVVEDSIHHGTEYGLKIYIKTQKNISPELLNIKLQHESGFIAHSIRSVSVIRNFEEDFYIWHQSDQHLTLDKAVEPGGKASATWGNGSKQAIQWIAPIMNLINPRFLLHTGDNMQIYNEPDHWCKMDEAKRRINRYLEALSGFKVATAAATGNHDIGFPTYVDIKDWHKVYEEWVGLRSFSFHMGSFYFLASEWTDPKFYNWTKNDYENTFKNKKIKYRLLASHYYDGLGSNSTIASETKPCDLLLVGHIHRTNILQTEPYKVLSVAAAQDNQRAAFFDFKKTLYGWENKQADLHANDVNVHRLVSNYGVPRVWEQYHKANNGEFDSNEVKITNQLPHNFYDGRIRFLMKKGKYTVNNAEVISTYDYDNGNKTVVIVKVNIPENDIITIMINKK